MINTSDLPNVHRRQMLVGSLLLGGAMLFGQRARADDANAPADPHAHHHHHAAAMPEGLMRSEASYVLPALKLVRQDGRQVDFVKEIDDGRPVILNFIYTSCTAICPVTTQVFSEVQGKLGNDRDKVHLVSISIDPEYDTPARLDSYAKKYQAGSGWNFYTGTADASVTVQKAFSVYRGDKMNHIPVTFLRAMPGKPWVRLEGFAKPDELAHEYHGLVHGA